ncbi:pectinesterase-like [Chenopodium quinoa]|uniref:pectinesterase-like n=1 Tax=Chenopodium quinoa TaxID=63459 RepID=UPI000B77E7ED|nr:pectinesterase-like [Chenopodium quinoa]
MAENNCVWLILLILVVAVPGVYFFVKYHDKLHKPNSITSNINFNATVSLDGDGDFTTISEAILSAPSYALSRFHIRVCSGVYNEVVTVPQSKTNIVLIGDGAEVTKITANRQISEFSTSETATFTVLGDGFMAQDIAFENNAGSESGQAVALLCSANHAIFYRCKVIGYHDTLYAKEGSQFYRECDIYGTVDFIFGFATAVFQKCNLYGRVSEYQIVTYTAQGRQSLDQNSGFTLQGCNFTSAPEDGLRTNISGFLGRPWFPYSTVMVMESFLDRLISPSGWEEWPNTTDSNAIYLEYRNLGPGADTSRRVKWSGFKVVEDASEALPYTASQLIQGNEWIPATKVPYDSEYLSSN